MARPLMKDAVLCLLLMLALTASWAYAASAGTSAAEPHAVMAQRTS